MREKVQDMPVRKEKVGRLKEKILAQTATVLQDIRGHMLELLPMVVSSFNEETAREWDALVAVEFNLDRLKEYIMDEDTFMIYRTVTGSDDIIYTVDGTDLDIWIQDRYDFPREFLFAVEDGQRDVFPLLNDDFFGHGFTNVIDRAMWQTKMPE